METLRIIKCVYRRHTNFAIEMYELPVDQARFGGRFTQQVLRNGDLAHKMYFRVTLAAVTGTNVNSSQYGDVSDAALTKVAWVRRLGHALVANAKLSIGGTIIDEHVGVWLDVWYELTHTTAQERGYNAMIGDVPELTTLTGPTSTSASQVVLPSYTLYVPFQFWFCRNAGLALPLIALQYHDVRLDVECEDLTKLVVWSGATAPNFSGYGFTDAGIMVDYVYLDSEERRRFAQVGHEYLIEQLQFGGADTVPSAGSSAQIVDKKKLQFNHPVKELVWCMRVGAFNGEANRSSFSGSRGRFLAYSNTDDWATTALDYAANNLLNGMVTLTNPSSSSYSAVTAPSAISADATYTFSASVTLVNTTLTFDVTVTNATSTNIASGANLFWVLKDPMASGSYHLGDSLTEAAISINVATVSSAGAVTSASQTNLAVVSHALTLRDVSIPVEDWTDNRTTTSGGVNPYDVSVIQLNNYGLRLDGAGNPLLTAEIQLNGHPRFQKREGSYFNYVQPWQHHTRTPADGVNVYSFGLHPEQHQPSGTCNLSRIDSTILSIVWSDPFRSGLSVASLDYVTDSKVYYFGCNYNVLRIMSGIAVNISILVYNLLCQIISHMLSWLGKLSMKNGITLTLNRFFLF